MWILGRLKYTQETTISGNASKSKQATSRKKSLEKIQLDEIKPSNRRYPYIDFKPDREPGKDILTVKNLSKTVDGEKVLDNVSFTVKTDNKIAIIADNENARTTLFQILAGELEPDEGEVSFGTTITKAYFPKDNQLMQTVANRIIDIKKDGSVVDKECTYNEYLGLE